MKLRSDEILLKGAWKLIGESVTADEVCRRIEWLVSCDLKEVVSSPVSGGWEMLFQDPSDGRYWERTFPHSEMHGGGAPQLAWLPEDEAKVKYKL